MQDPRNWTSPGCTPAIHLVSPTGAQDTVHVESEDVPVMYVPIQAVTSLFATRRATGY